MAAMRLGGTLAKVAARSAEGFSVPDAAQVAAVRILGRPAVVIYRADAGEFGRRGDTGLGVITRVDLLDLLLGLPHGCPVPSGSLAMRERSLLRDLPPGSVDLEPGTVIRRATVPLKVDLAVVPAGDWRRGLDQASLFAPFCSRAVVLARLPADADHLLLEAAYYGIGVAVAGDSDIEVLADPQPFNRQCYKAAGWWFAEQVYAQVTGQEKEDFPA
jgi:hypothetical protein